jgi:hypothetical protein
MEGTGDLSIIPTGTAACPASSSIPFIMGEGNPSLQLAC